MMTRENVKSLIVAVEGQREAVQMLQRDMKSATSKVDKAINMLQNKK